MDGVEDSPQGRSEFLEGFTLLLGFTETCGICLIILVTIWMSYYRDGFSWRSDPKLEFNWHPLLMIIGLVYLYGNGKHLNIIFFRKKIFPFVYIIHESIFYLQPCLFTEYVEMFARGD